MEYQVIHEFLSCTHEVYILTRKNRLHGRSEPL